MERTAHLMTKLLKSELRGTAFRAEGDPPTEAEIAELYRLSKRHDLAHLVGDALAKSGLLPKTETGAKFEKQMVMAVFRCENLQYDLDRIRTVLDGAGIAYLPLKGAVIRPLYPQPWMRTSCDIDILVKKQNLDAAEAAIETQLQYRRNGNTAHDISLYAPGGTHLELHHTLLESRVVGRADEVLRRVWAYASPTDERGCCHRLTDGMFYYYHIAHMAKHFMNGGCGVRPLMDIYLLNQHVCDRNEREALLAEGGLLSFARMAEQLADIWFGEGAHTDLTRKMEAYLFHGGVYGTLDQMVAVGHNKKGGRAGYLLSRIWLPYDTLRHHYPSLDGRPYLLPFYEIRRWGKLLRRPTRRRTANELKLSRALSQTRQTEVGELLAALGLTEGET